MSVKTYSVVENDSGWLALLSRHGGVRLAVLCLGVWLHAASSMLAATTLPSAIREFGGGALIGWAFALYLLGSIVAGASTGLLARSHELRTGLIMAAGLYLIGCIVCAIAPDMTVVLSGRLLQGLGGGFLIALTYVGLNRWFDKNHLPRLLALVSVVWSISAFCGPLVGGTFATFGDWRFAFWAFAGQALLFIALATVFMKSEVQAASLTRLHFPALRLLVLGLSILSVAIAGAKADMTVSPVLCVVAVGLLWLVFNLDGKRPHHRMFPHKPLSSSHSVGAGLVFVFVASFSTMSFLVYGPVLLETLHGVTPLTAGYIVAVESIAWGSAAFMVSGRSQAAQGRLIRIGAALVTAGVLGFALTMRDGPLWAVILCATVQGAGFGVMWAFVITRITENAPGNERDVVSSSIPTMQQIGFAFGAAAAGVVANMVGFGDVVTIAAARDAAVWVFAAFVPFALYANIAAWRLAR